MAKFSCNFISYTLRRTVDVMVIIPSATIPESSPMIQKDGFVPKHTKADKFPVLYLLHGGGNNHAQWTGYTNIELYAEEHQIAVVMPASENKCFVDVNGDRFYEFIAEELPDFVKGMFPISDKPEDTYIAGLSMGGYGTLVHALSHPERFAALGAFSAAINLNPMGMAKAPGDPESEKASEERFDTIKLLHKDAESGVKMPKFYIACGKQDFLYEKDQAFAEEAKALGCDVTTDYVDGYGHEWRFWDMQVEKFLNWIPRTDAYAGGKRKV